MISSSKKSRFFLGFAVIVFILLAFAGGFLIGQRHPSDSDKKEQLDLSSIFNNEEDVKFSLVRDAWDIIHNKYVDSEELDDRKLIFGAIKGMVKEVDDPFTVFFNKEETKQFESSVKGKFGGVGIEITMREGQLTVVSPIRGTPAFEAGVEAEDKIIKIDGENTEGIKLEEAVSKIRGDEGTTVVLTVERSDGEVLDIPIERDIIKVPNIDWQILEDGVAYIEIKQFSEPTARDFKKAAQNVLESNADKIIIDVRNNPGGFLDRAIDVSGWFIEKDKVVVYEKRGPNKKITHTSSGPNSFEGFKVVVLQNKGSASASEIFAGALRDHEKATIIGEKSFGKGSVQSFENLAGNTGLKVTIAKWFTPSNEIINDKGITPDIKVELTQEDAEAGRDPQKNRAIEFLKN